VLIMDTARFKYPPFWVDLDFLHNSVKTMDEDSKQMRGFIVLRKKTSERKCAISLKEILPRHYPENLCFKEITNEQLISIIEILNSDEVKVHLFKFLHSLHMVFGGGKAKCNNIPEDYEPSQDTSLIEKCVICNNIPELHEPLS